MPLDIVVLDCSNYPQLVVVEETSIEEDRKRWERDGPESAKVFAHLGVRQGEADSYAGDVLAALCQNGQFKRGLTEILEQVFRSGREFERQYPKGRGSNGDMRVYRGNGEFQFYANVIPKELYRSSKTGLERWSGTAGEWEVVSEMHEHASPVREHIARFYMKEISVAAKRPVADSEIDNALFAA